MRFKVLSHLLPKSDQRYIRWRESLKKRPPPWNKDKTKENDISVMKISKTFKKNKLDNFKKWRDVKLKEHRKIINSSLKRDYHLAVLTGLVLGDGHIHKFQRTEGLDVALNTKYPDLIKYTAKLIEQVFNKKPTVQKMKHANCVKVRLYQQNISYRLGIKTGDKRKDLKGGPIWIFKQRNFIIGYLKGLFEAEGSLSIHLPTCTYNFQFCNKNKILLKQVKESLIKLGYHPEVRRIHVRLRKRKEVLDFKELIRFRQYEF